MPSDDPLAGLRALHLPPEAASWQSDLGLAAAAGLALAFVAALALKVLVKPRRSLRASALDEFLRAQELAPEERRAAQAAILRRVVRSTEGEAAARATGPAWAATLDRAFSTDLFSRREGKVFVEGLYVRPAAPAADDPALDRELGALLEKVRR